MPLRVLAVALMGFSATPALALDFVVSQAAPVGLGLSAEAGLSNRSFFFQATTKSDAATNFTVTLSTYDASCDRNPICSRAYPGGNLVAFATYAISAAQTTASYQLSLPSTNLSTVSPVSVIFSTTGSSAISFTNVVSETAALVPEPTTWALILAGFGMVGYSLRRRRYQVATA